MRASQPVHVVIRALPAVGSLRQRLAHTAIRLATIVAAKREDFRIVHISIQDNHVHLIVEAEDRGALSRGMQGFQISAAKQLNRVLGRRKGSVFGDRFHSTILATPRQVRNTLAYVLNNWRRHREDRQTRARSWQLDPFSSAIVFDGWKERQTLGLSTVPDAYRALVVWFPKTWLLTTGWRRHGLISQWEVPKGKPASRRS